jgi:hypothetical protein
MKSLMAGITLWAGLLSAQTAINGGRTVKGAWDASGAVSTKPAKAGAATPGACSSGEIFFNTGASGGQNLYLCQPDNVWTQLSAGGGGGIGANESNTFGSGTVQTFQGTLDASGAAATLPAQTGATLPTACATGQLFLKTGSDPSRMLYVCSATNTWTQTAYAQGTAALMPTTCGIGQLYFATDATAGQNLNLCTAANTWSRAGGLAGSGATNQMAFFSDAGTVASDNKVTRDSGGSLNAVGMYANSINATYSTGAGWRIYFSVDYANCTSGAVTLSTAYSIHYLSLNDQATCAITLSGGNGGELGIVKLCQGNTTPTTTLTWNGAKGGMAAAGGVGTCMAQTFVYDAGSSSWYATSSGVPNM